MLKRKVIISIVAERAFDNIQHFLSKLGIEGNFLNLIKNIFKNPTDNIITNGEQLKA